jgi:hypothetical protein
MHRFKCLIFHDYNCSFTNVNDVFELLHSYLNVVICSDVYGASLLLLIVTNEPNISYFFFLIITYFDYLCLNVVAYCVYFFSYVNYMHL